MNDHKKKTQMNVVVHFFPLPFVVFAFAFAGLFFSSPALWLFLVVRGLALVVYTVFLSVVRFFFGVDDPAFLPLAAGLLLLPRLGAGLLLLPRLAAGLLERLLVAGLLDLPFLAAGLLERLFVAGLFARLLFFFFSSLAAGLLERVFLAGLLERVAERPRAGDLERPRAGLLERERLVEPLFFLILALSFGETRYDPLFLTRVSFSTPLFNANLSCVLKVASGKLYFSSTYLLIAWELEPPCSP